MNQSHALPVDARHTNGGVLGQWPAARLEPGTAVDNAICGIRHRGQQCGFFAIEIPIDLMSHSWGAGLMGIGNPLKKDKSSPAIFFLANYVRRRKESAHFEKAVLVHDCLLYRKRELYTSHFKLSLGNLIKFEIARCIECHRPEGEPYRMDWVADNQPHSIPDPKFFQLSTKFRDLPSRYLQAVLCILVGDRATTNRCLNIGINGSNFISNCRSDLIEDWLCVVAVHNRVNFDIEANVSREQRARTPPIP